MGIKKNPKNFMACSSGLGEHKNLFENYFQRSPAPQQVVRAKLGPHVGIKTFPKKPPGLLQGSGRLQKSAQK
jgi:hypothetical protein